MSTYSTTTDSRWTAAAEGLQRLETLARDVVDVDRFYVDAVRLVAETLESPRCVLSLEQPAGRRVLGTTADGDDSAGRTGAIPHRATSRLSDTVTMTLACDVGTASDRCEELSGDLSAGVLDLCVLVYLKSRFRQVEASGPAATGDEPNLTTSLPPRRTRRSAWWGVSALLACVVVSAFPVDFRLPVEGTVQPKTVRHVFAPLSGTVASVSTDEGETVSAGSTILVIENPEVRLRHETLAGELATAEAELVSLRVEQTDPSRAREHRTDTAGRRRILQTRIESLQRQVDLAERLQACLIVTAPIDGEVTGDHAVRDLVGRRVAPGQWLVDVIDLEAGFIAELFLPDRDFGYLAARQSGPPLICQFRLRSDPNVRLRGSVDQISDSSQRNERGEAVIRLTSRLQTDQPLRHGATLVGHVDAGRRPLGFVLFRPVIEWIRSQGW